MTPASGTTLFTMRQRLRPRGLSRAIFLAIVRQFLHFMQVKPHFSTQIITFTCIASTWYAQTRGRISLLFAKTQFYLVRSLIFCAPGPLPGLEAIKSAQGLSRAIFGQYFIKSISLLYASKSSTFHKKHHCYLHNKHLLCSNAR